MPRTQLAGWQINTANVEGGSMKYVEAKLKTAAHVSNDIVTYVIPFDPGINGVNIKTLRIKSEEDVTFIATLMDGNTLDLIYESREMLKFHYDNIDIPYKPSERAFFVKIWNKGSRTTTFDIKLTGIEVK